MSELGDLIAKTRKDRGMTLRELAAATGGKVSNAYISQIETGKILEPSLVVVHRLAVALCAPFEQLALAAVQEISSPPAPICCETCGQILRRQSS